jgi:hypothetical protein
MATVASSDRAQTRHRIRSTYISKTLTLRGGYSPDFGAWHPGTYPTTLDAMGRGHVAYIVGVDDESRVGAPDIGADEYLWRAYLPLVVRQVP